MNPLLNRVNPNNQQNIYNQFGGYQNFLQTFNTFKNQFYGSSALTPQQVVQNMLNSGQMSQAQFEQLRSMANQITGKNF